MRLIKLSVMIFLCLNFLELYSGIPYTQYGGSSSYSDGVNYNGTRQCSYSINKDELYVTSGDGVLTTYDMTNSRIKDIYQLPIESYDRLGYICLLPNEDEYIGSDLALYNFATHQKKRQIDTSVKYAFNKIMEYNQKYDVVCYKSAYSHIPSEYIYYSSVHSNELYDSIKVEAFNEFACELNGDYLYYPYSSNIAKYSFKTKKTTTIDLPESINFAIRSVSISDDKLALMGARDVAVYDMSKSKIVYQNDDIYWGVRADISPDGKYLAYPTYQTTKVVNIETGESKSYNPLMSTTMVEFIDNNRLIITHHDQNNLITIINISQQKQIPISFTSGSINDGLVLQNNMIYVSYNNGVLQLVCKDNTNGELEWFKYIHEDRYTSKHRDVFTELSPNESYMAIAVPFADSTDAMCHDLYILDTHTGDVLHKNTNLYLEVFDMQFVDNQLLIAANDNQLLSLDLKSFELYSKFTLDKKSMVIKMLQTDKDQKLWYMKYDKTTAVFYSCYYDLDANDFISSNELINVHYDTRFRESKLNPSGTLLACETRKNYVPWIDIFDLKQNKRIDSFEMQGYCCEFITDSTLIYQEGHKLVELNVVSNEITDTIYYDGYKSLNAGGLIFFSFLNRVSSAKMVGSSGGIMYIFDLIQTSIEKPIVFESSDKLYPNPVSNNTITIEHDNEIPEIDRISICDISGVDITNFTFNHTGSETEIYLGEIPPGVYFISYAANGSLYSHKFVVE